MSERSVYYERKFPCDLTGPANRHGSGVLVVVLRLRTYGNMQQRTKATIDYTKSKKVDTPHPFGLVELEETRVRVFVKKLEAYCFFVGVVAAVCGLAGLIDVNRCFGVFFFRLVSLVGGFCAIVLLHIWFDSAICELLIRSICMYIHSVASISSKNANQLHFLCDSLYRNCSDLCKPRKI